MPEPFWSEVAAQEKAHIKEHRDHFKRAERKAIYYANIVSGR